MKILVTGATGFIGYHLLPLLRDKAHEIVVLTRDPKSAGIRLPVACQVIQWDPESESLSPEVFEGVGAVIHLAGEGVLKGLWTQKRKREIFQSRVLSTRCLVETMRMVKRKPEVFLSASAIAIYGDRGDETLNETSSLKNGFLAGVCRKWEGEVFQAETLGIRTAALRFGPVLGHGGALKMMLPFFRLGLGGPLGRGQQWMSWIHVHDVARFIIHVVEHSILHGPVNVVSPNPVTNKEFSRTLGLVLRRPAILSVPGVVIKLLLGEMSELVLNSQKVSPDKALESGFKFLYPKLETALRFICHQSRHEHLMEQ